METLLLATATVFAPALIIYYIFPWICGTNAYEMSKNYGQYFVRGIVVGTIFLIYFFWRSILEWFVTCFTYPFILLDALNAFGIIGTVIGSGLAGFYIFGMFRYIVYLINIFRDSRRKPPILLTQKQREKWEGKREKENEKQKEDGQENHNGKRKKKKKIDDEDDIIIG